MLVNTSLYLLNTRPEALGPPKTERLESPPSPPSPPAEESNVLKRFKHPDYKYLAYINPRNVKEILDPRNLSRLARMAGIQQVMRWKPAQVSYPLTQRHGRTCTYLSRVILE